MEDMEELREAEVNLSIPSFPLPYPIGVHNGWHLRLSVCASLFRETGAEMGFAALVRVRVNCKYSKTRNITELQS